MIAGCRECAHNTSETFMMDEALGCARVRVQFGDSEKKIEVEFCHGIQLDLVNGFQFTLIFGEKSVIPGDY